MQDPETELARDIGYALSRSTFKAKGQPIEALRIVAGHVVAHLKRAGWMFALKPPQAMHGPSTGPQTGPSTEPSTGPPTGTPVEQERQRDGLAGGSKAAPE